MQSKLSERGKKWSQMLQSLTNRRNAVVNDYKRTNQNFVNLALGQFVDKLRRKTWNRTGSDRRKLHIQGKFCRW